MEVSVTPWGCVVLLLAEPWAAGTGGVIAGGGC